MPRHISRRTAVRLVALSPLALARPARAQDLAPAPTCLLPPPMGTIGLVPGRRLRVSLFRHGTGTDAYAIRVVGLHGGLLGLEQGALAADRGASVDLDPAGKKGEPVQVHVEVRWESGEAAGATAEVYDAKTGATAYAVDPCLLPSPPSRLRTAGVGLAAGQVARVSLFHHADFIGDPCQYEVRLLGLDGKVLAGSQGTVSPGRGVVAIEWGDGSVGFPPLKEGERVQVHADVLVDAQHLGHLGRTLEVVDAKTGATAYPTDPCELPRPA